MKATISLSAAQLRIAEIAFWLILAGSFFLLPDKLTLMSQIGAIPAKHLLFMYLAGFRVWFAAGIGLAAGVLLMLLARFILS